MSDCGGVARGHPGASVRRGSDGCAARRIRHVHRLACPHGPPNTHRPAAQAIYAESPTPEKQNVNPDFGA